MHAGSRIALIDDDRNWAETLAEYLHRQRFLPQTAHDGVQGLALLERTGIPVALVDLNMPGMTGLELLRLLRQRRRPVAVLLLSGEDDPTLAARVRAEGGQACLSKTASPRLVVEAVRQTLARMDQPWSRLLPVPRAWRRSLS